MTPDSLLRRARRRSLHRSRSTSSAVTLVLLAVVAAWLGTESVLAAVGARPLLVAPDTLLSGVLRPGGAFVPIVIGGSVLAVVIGVVLVCLAIGPGRRARVAVAADAPEIVVVADRRVLADTAAGAAASAASVPRGHVVADVGARSVRVRVTPTSGMPVDRESVADAVRERVADLDPRTSGRVRVDVSPTGRIA